MNLDTKISNKELADQIQQYIKKMNTMIMWDLAQEYNKADSTYKKSM